MVCPNHDESSICPDCTYRPGHKIPLASRLAPPSAMQPIKITGQNYFVQASPPPTQTRRSLPPLEQHKSDLEMIIAACVTGADKTGEAACTSIAKLANALLLRLEISNCTCATDYGRSVDIGTPHDDSCQLNSKHVVINGKCSCAGGQL